MKFIQYATILAVTLSCIGIVQAKDDIFFTAPFHHVEVRAASKIYVNYDFNSHQQTLVCQADSANDAITSVEWSYKDATRKIELPVTLKDDSRFTGFYADPEGKLIITNDFGSSSNTGNIFVSCEYRNNMK